MGGSSYITSLINGVPTSGNIEYYGRIVEQMSSLRKLIAQASKIVSIAYEREPDAVMQAEELIHSVSQHQRTSHVKRLREGVSRYMDKLQTLHDRRQNGIITGIPTGFNTLDHVLGGLQDSDLYILAARPAKGKTSLLLNMAEHIITQAVVGEKSVLMFSLEMGEEQLVRRMISMKSGIDQTRLRTADIDDDEWQQIVDASSALSLDNMWIDDTAGISLVEMQSRARRIQAEHGLDLVMVDYLQLMKATMTGSVENRVQEVGMISRGLKEMARSLNVPVIALAQLSRAVEQRADKVPQLSDLRESGSIEADADVVMFIHEDANTKHTENGYLLNIIIDKHRNGPTGIAPLWFKPELTRFTDVEGELFPSADEEDI